MKHNQLFHKLNIFFSGMIKRFWEYMCYPKCVYVILPNNPESIAYENALVRIEQLIKEGYQVTIV